MKKKLFNADIVCEFFSDLVVKREVSYEYNSYIIETSINGVDLEKKVFSNVYELDNELKRGQEIWESVLNFCSCPDEKESLEKENLENENLASQD